MSCCKECNEPDTRRQIFEYVNDVFVMAMSLSMIIVGANHDKETGPDGCHIPGVTLYLQVGGALTLTFTGFSVQTTCKFLQSP